MPKCTLLTWSIINISIVSIRFLNLCSFYYTTLSPTMPQIIWQIMQHLCAKPAGLLRMSTVTLLTLSNEDYLCQGNVEDNPIQINIILDENKLVNWFKSFFFLAEINFQGKYRSLRGNKKQQSATWWIVSLKQILNRFFGWLCLISHTQRLLALFGLGKSGTLHWINLCSNNPGSFSKMYTHFVCSLQLYKYLLDTI